MRSTAHLSQWEWVALWLVLAPLGSLTALTDSLDQWQQRSPIPTVESLNAVAFGQGQWVAVGSNGEVLTSSAIGNVGCAIPTATQSCSPVPSAPQGMVGNQVTTKHPPEPGATARQIHGLPFPVP